MPGPAPKPTALKLLAGNPGNRPLPKDEPKPRIEPPKCPKHLSRMARAEWRRIVPELEELGLLSKIDRAALAGYCAAYGRWMEAERELKKSGLTQTTPNGHVQKSAWLTIADKALDQMKKYIALFGLSPADRTRVSATPKDDDEEFFNR